MKNKILWLVFGLLLTIGALVTYRYFNGLLLAPEFKTIDSVEFQKINDSKAYFTAEATFFNPNDLEAQLLNSEIKVLSKGLEIAGISQSNYSKIRGKSAFKVRFNFYLDVSNLSLSHGLSGLLANMLSENKEIPVHFSGYTRVKSQGDVFKIPIESDQILVLK